MVPAPGFRGAAYTASREVVVAPPVKCTASTIASAALGIQTSPRQGSLARGRWGSLGPNPSIRKEGCMEESKLSDRLSAEELAEALGALLSDDEMESVVGGIAATEFSASDTL